MADYKKLYYYLKDEIEIIAAALGDMSVETENPDFGGFKDELLLILEYAEELRLSASCVDKNE